MINVNDLIPRELREKLEEEIHPLAVPHCPLCMQTIGTDQPFTGLIAYGCVFLAHRECLDKLRQREWVKS